MRSRYVSTLSRIDEKSLLLLTQDVVTIRFKWWKDVISTAKGLKARRPDRSPNQDLSIESRDDAPLAKTFDKYAHTLDPKTNSPGSELGRDVEGPLESIGDTLTGPDTALEPIFLDLEPVERIGGDSVTGLSTVGHVLGDGTCVDVNE